MERIARYRYLLMCLGVMLFAIAYPASQRLRFERSVSTLFDADDPVLQAYQSLQTAFGGNSVVILVYEDAELETSEGLIRNQAIADRVKQISGVEGVLSPAKLSRAVSRLQPLSFFSRQPGLFQSENAVAEGFDELFAGYTHSADHKRAAVVALLSDDRTDETLDGLREVAETLRQGISDARVDRTNPIGMSALVGEPVLVDDGFDLIERDGRRLAFTTVGLLAVVIFICLFDLRLVSLAGVSVLWSVVLARAAMVWLEINLSLVSSILTAIVAVIAVASVLHLGLRFQTSRTRGRSRHEAMVNAFTVLTLPIVWTCGTDAAGFAALTVSGIEPIRQFGVMISIAALAVLTSVFLFGPALMLLPRLIPLPYFTFTTHGMSRWLRRICLAVAEQSIRRRWTCVFLSVAALAIAIAGIGMADTETSFLKNFRDNSSIVSAYEQVETHFGGAGVWDVVVDAPETITADFLNQVRLLEDDLRSIEIGDDQASLGKVLSLADAEAVTAQATVSSMASPSARLAFMSIAMPSFYNALMTPAVDGRRRMRIMLRSREHLPASEKDKLIAEVQRVVDEHTTSNEWLVAAGQSSAASVTGYYVVMADLVDQLVRDQWRCFAASGFLVWLLLVVATRSWRQATVALIPNLLPVFLVLAAIGFSGSKINMGAAMIAAVSIGLSIDGSVHFLAGYRRAKRKRTSAWTAARHAAGNIGPAILLATLALVIGFGVLGTSEFVPTATFGKLVSITLALGTLVNLTLLPALVVWVDR